jgi:hypothetical protein
MPANNVTLLEVYQHLSNVAAFTYSPQDTGVFLKNVPAGLPGMIITMPADPSDGDRYSFADVDGSLSTAHVLEVRPDPAGTATIDGAVAVAYFTAKAGATFIFDGDANDWVVVDSATGAFDTNANVVSTNQAGGPATLGDLTTGTATPINLFAIGMKPKSSGLVELLVMLTFALSAADTVTMAVASQADVSAITGGTQVTASPQLNVESGQGAGQPVVVTGGATTAQGSNVQEIATGGISKVTLVYSAFVQLTPAALAANFAAIVATIAAAGGATITGITATISARELF